MALLSRIKQRFSRDKVDLQLDDIQALILRNRPEVSRWLRRWR